MRVAAVTVAVPMCAMMNNMAAPVRAVVSIMMIAAVMAAAVMISTTMAAVMTTAVVTATRDGRHAPSHPLGAPALPPLRWHMLISVAFTFTVGR